MREVVTYGEYVVARMRSVTEDVKPIAAVKPFVPRTAEGRHEAIENCDHIFGGYLARIIPPQVQSPVATKGWDRSRSC
jgi:hypothetical protein